MAVGATLFVLASLSSPRNYLGLGDDSYFLFHMINMVSLLAPPILCDVFPRAANSIFAICLCILAANLCLGLMARSKRFNFWPLLRGRLSGRRHSHAEFLEMFDPASAEECEPEQ